MASITDLRQKRAALWEKTKKFLDNAKRENDMLSAEDVETYEKMESVKYLLDALRFYVCGKNRRHYGELKTSVISGGRTNISRISRESRLCQSKSESLAAEAHFTRKPTIRQE